MTPIQTGAQRPATILLIVLSLFTFQYGCNRKSPPSEVKESSVPSAGSTTPAPCSVTFNGDLVNDSAGVISSDAKRILEQKLDNLKSKASIDFSVVTVQTTKDQSIADYSLALARCWSVGGDNPDQSGLLLLLAVNDRKWHMQISRSIEKVLSNDEIQQAASLMTPELSQGNYSEGIEKCVDATIRTIAPRRNFSADSLN
jgi:uncharacterized protein